MSQVTPSGTVTSTKLDSADTMALTPRIISHTTRFGSLPPSLKNWTMDSTNSFVGVYRAAGSSGTMGSGVSSERPGSSGHAPCWMAVMQRCDAVSVSPTLIAWNCQHVLVMVCGWRGSCAGAQAPRRRHGVPPHLGWSPDYSRCHWLAFHQHPYSPSQTLSCERA